MGGQQMKRTALISLIISCIVTVAGCSFGPTPTGSIEGYVYEPEDGQVSRSSFIAKGFQLVPEGYQPLEGALVKVTGTTNIAYTNSQGYFRIDSIPARLQTVTIAHPNYKPQSISVWVQANRVTPLPDILTGVGYYLLIGVGRYDSNIQNTWHPKPLAGPPNDVENIRTVLIEQNTLAKYESIEFVNETATVEAVLDTARHLAHTLDSEDYLVIYFSGHSMGGDPEHYYPDALLVYDGLITDGQLQDALSGIATDDVTLIIDGCNSGAFADGHETWPPANRVLRAFQREGYTVITASDPDESALEIKLDDGTSRGLFTYYFVEGLDQGRADRTYAGNYDGRITVTEIYEYVSRKVSNYCAKLSNDFTQTVTLFQGSGDPVIYQY